MACPTGDKQLAVARGTPTVDGALDDAIWASACWVSDFEEQQPVYRAKPKYPVKVAIAIDDDTLYVGARMWSAGPDDLDAALTQRDDLSQAERFIVSIDPSNTKRLAYSFASSVAGVRSDWIHTDDTQGARDPTWNPVWTARTKILADGWSVEMAMPLSQLRLPSRAQASWGIDFNWYIPHRHEDVFWRAVSPDNNAWASVFGSLVDLPPIEDRISLELLPYIAARVSTNEIVPAPPEHRVIGGFEAGLDAKVRRGGLVLTATLNPDFGQVDVDPAFVNLSAFEVLLPEKRPFFVENNTLFANNPANFFYSRRIGALPRSLPSADAIDVPTQVRILGALALGGNLAEHTQIAALVAVTDKTEAEAIVGGARTTLPVAPLSIWSATRIEHQIGRTVIGANTTAMHRDLDVADLKARLPATAMAGGADALTRSSDGVYELAGFAGGTYVTGSPTSIAAIAGGSAHYFQRPDATHVELDPTSDHLSGWTGGVFGAKRAGRWRGEGGVYAESPGYEPNDMGRLQSADDIGGSLEGSYFETIPTENIFSWNATAGIGQEWNFGGLRKPAQLYGNGNVVFPSFSSAHVDATFTTPGTQDDLTRGGPRMAVGWAAHAGASASTQRDRSVQLTGNLAVDVSPTLAQGVRASAALIARVTPALRFDVTPSLSIARDRRQFVAAVDSATADDTFGTRYLFGDLRHAEAALELRTTWSLSPDLVVTLYAQPFAAVGKYRSFGELVAAGSADVRNYTDVSRGDGTRVITDGADQFSIDEPDFTVVSLRSTAVLKWELKPGSTLFVVWQQSRGEGAALSHPLHDTLDDIFTSHGFHTLAVKLSYWWG